MRLRWSWAFVLAFVIVPGCSWLPHPAAYQDPLTAQEHMALGETYAQQGHPDLASREFEAALKRQPDHVPAFVALGNLAFQNQSLTAAESYYRRALELSPAHPVAANNLAMVYLSKDEKFDEVERLARTALQHETHLKPYILETLATLYLKQGKLMDAQTVLEQADAVTPTTNAALLTRLSQLRQELTDHRARTPVQQ